MRQGDAHPKGEGSDDRQGADNGPARPVCRSPSVPAPGTAANERGGEEQHRPDKVKLLFYAERPVILQGRHWPLCVEVVGRLYGESIIADVEGARHGVFGDCFRLEGTEHGDRRHDGHHDHQHGRRQEATGATRVEAGERYASAGQLAPKKLGDQISRDDEEDVDAHVAPRHREAGVVGDDGEDRDRPESLDVGSPASLSHPPLPSR